MRGRSMTWVLGLVLLLLAGGRASAQGPREAPATASADGPSSKTILVVSRSGVQLDVWIDGVRRGGTPLAVRLETGEHFITAAAPGIEPVLEKIEVAAGPGQQTTYLLPVPMTPERFPGVFREVVQAYTRNRQNPHVLIAAALLTPDRTDFEGLLARIPVEHHEDPMLLLARSKWAYKAGDDAGALALLEKATAKDEQLAAPWRERARFMILQNRLPEAVLDAERAVRLEPLNADNFVVRGDAYHLSLKPYAAQLDYERALDLRPDHPGALAGLDALREARQ